MPNKIAAAIYPHSVMLDEPYRRMKRSLALGALLWPMSAAAHGSASIFYLLWWHVVLVLCMLCFLVFTSVNKKRKLFAISGFVLVPVVVWSILANLSGDFDAWLDMVFYVAAGAAPLIGFIGGLYLTRKPRLDH